MEINTIEIIEHINDLINKLIPVKHQLEFLHELDQLNNLDLSYMYKFIKTIEDLNYLKYVLKEIERIIK